MRDYVTFEEIRSKIKELVDIGLNKNEIIEKLARELQVLSSDIKDVYEIIFQQD